MKQSLNQDVNISKRFERNTDEFIEDETKYKPRFEQFIYLRWLRAILRNLLKVIQSLTRVAESNIEEETL